MGSTKLTLSIFLSGAVSLPLSLEKSCSSNPSYNQLSRMFLLWWVRELGLTQQTNLVVGG